MIKIATPAELQAGKVMAQDDMVTWKWQASNVPDFVVALSDHYNWDGGSVVVDGATGRCASVQAAYDDAAKDFQQMVEYGKSALGFGSTQWPGVPYPYSKTTIFRGLADEEYPMFANDDTNEDPGVTRFVVTYADGTQGSFRQNPALWQNSPQAATIALGTTQDITKLLLDGGIFMDATPPDNTWEPAK